MNCRIFIEEPEISGDGAIVTLTGERARYVTRVLRLQEDDRITLFDGKGAEYFCAIKEAKGKTLTLSLMEKRVINRESNLKIELCQAVPKGKKMDLIIQKGTELGVHLFAPFVSSRTISRPDERDCANKVKRWRKVAFEAARQCGRNIVPAVNSVTSMKEMLEKVRSEKREGVLRIMLWEGEETNSLNDVVSKIESPLNASGGANRPPKEVVVLIGPEGGFSIDEAAAARDEGFLTVSFGKRLLRTETAGLAAVSVLQYLWGDLG